MTRLVILVASIAVLIGAAFLAGKNLDRAQELRNVIDTKEDIKNAQDNAGDCNDSWLECLLRHRGE